MRELGTTFERVCHIVAVQMGVAKDQITTDTNLVEDLCADSLDGFNLLLEFEEEFNLPRTSEQDAETFVTTVGAIVDYIDKAPPRVAYGEHWEH